MAARLLEWEQETRILFGRPYYWEIVDGKHTLRPGLSPTDVARATADAKQRELDEAPS